MKLTKLRVALLGAAVVALFGCGGGGSANNQGVSFSLLGFFAIDDEGLIDCETRSSGSVTAISFSNETGGLADVITALGVVNMLDGQFVRTERVQLSYIIPGAISQPPDTSLPLGMVVGPATNTVGTSLPPGWVGGGDAGGPTNQECRAFAVVPSSILSWINLNRNDLPEPPFIMEAFVTVRGITSAGDVLDSNTLSYPVWVQNDNVIGPTPGAPTGDEGAAFDEGSEFDGTDTE